MMKTNKLQPFDIEKAKAGAKVVTRDGRDVRILCYNRIDRNYPIVALIRDENVEEVEAFTPNGNCFIINESDYDLFICEEDEVKYRPYTSAEEMDAAIKEHGLFVKDLYGGRLVITSYDDENVSVGIANECSFEALLKYYTWIDGTPCGVLEGGEK